MEKHDITKPEPFSYNENENVKKIGEDWNIWKTKFKSYARLLSSYNKSYDSKEKVAKLFLDTVGEQCIKILKSAGQLPKLDLAVLLSVLDKTLNPPISEAEARIQFESSKIKRGESWPDFAKRLKKKITLCNFGKEADKRLMELMVNQMNDDLRNLISHSKPSNLSEFLQICNRYVKYANELEKMTAPNVSFKDPSVIKCKNGSKCAKQGCKYLHALKQCKFDPNCMILDCEYYHETPIKSKDDIDLTDDEESYNKEIVAIKCMFGRKCQKKNCKFSHVLEDCKFYPKCTAPNCQFYHPHNGSKTTLSSPDEYSEDEKNENCEFGPKCSDKKCKLQHVLEKCKYYPKCASTNCKYYHDPEDSNKKTKQEKKTIKCMFGVWCKNENCDYLHVKEKCKFHPKCTSKDCKFDHPKGTEGSKDNTKKGTAASHPTKNASGLENKKKRDQNRKKKPLKFVGPLSLKNG